VVNLTSLKLSAKRSSGALARANAMLFMEENGAAPDMSFSWSTVTQWHEYSDGLVVAKTDAGWVIVRKPTVLVFELNLDADAMVGDGT